MKTYIRLAGTSFCILLLVTFGFACTDEKNSGDRADKTEQTTDAKGPAYTSKEDSTDIAVKTEQIGDGESKLVFEPELYYNMPFDELDSILGLSEDGGLHNYRGFRSIYFNCNEQKRVAQIEFYFLKPDIPFKQMGKLGYADIAKRSFEGNRQYVRRWTNVNSRVKTITAKMERDGTRTTWICVTFWNAY